MSQNYNYSQYLDFSSVVINPKNNICDTNYIVFDIETTGLNPQNDYIIEIGAVTIKNGRVQDEFFRSINPGIHIPDNVTNATGSTDEIVSNADNIESVIKDFLSYCGDAVLVAHNASFDFSFIRKNIDRFKLDKDFTVIDTMQLARVLTGLPRVTLNRLKEYYGISCDYIHDTISDAKCTAYVFLEFLKILKGRGINNLTELKMYCDKYS